MKPAFFQKATHRICVGGCGMVVDMEGNIVRESRFTVQKREVPVSTDQEGSNGQVQERVLGGGVADDSEGDKKGTVPTKGRKRQVKGKVKTSSSTAKSPSATGRRDRK